MFFLLKKKSHCIRVKQPQKITRKHRQSGANKKKAPIPVFIFFCSGAELIWEPYGNLSFQD